MGQQSRECRGPQERVRTVGSAGCGTRRAVVCGGPKSGCRGCGVTDLGGPRDIRAAGSGGPRGWGRSAGARGRGRRQGRPRRYLTASAVAVAVAVAPRPGGRAGRPGLPQQRGAGPRSGPRSRSGSGSGARSGPRSRAAAAAGLRMLGAGCPRRAGARLAPVSQRRSRPAFTPPASRGRARRPLRSGRRPWGARVTSPRGAGPGGAPAALRQRVAPRDDRRALRLLQRGRAAARGTTGGARPRGRARARGKNRAPSTLPGGGAPAAGPGPPCRCHGDAWPVARTPPHRASVTSRSRHLTSRPGGAAGRGQRGAGRLPERAAGVGWVGPGGARSLGRRAGGLAALSPRSKKQ